MTTLNTATDVMSDDELETSLHTWEAVASYARAVQMRLLREVDRRQLATRDGSRSLAEWTASRLDVSLETASALTWLAVSPQPEALGGEPA